MRVSSLLLLLPAVALAQPMPMGPHGRGPMYGMQYMHLFDPATVATVSGTVVRLERVPMRRHTGVAAVVKTAEGELSVHLGPDWFIDHQELQLAPGEAVQIRGSRMTFAGKPAMIAIEVKRGADTLTLRDERGVPVWVGWRRAQ